MEAVLRIILSFSETFCFSRLNYGKVDFTKFLYIRENLSGIFYLVLFAKRKKSNSCNAHKINSTGQSHFLTLHNITTLTRS